MTHPNVDLIRRYSAALTAGRAADALPFYTEDLVLHIPGRSPHAGTFHGQDAVLAYYTRLFRDTDGRPCILFWMRGVEDIGAGWAGAHSVPYVLGVDGDRLTAVPHPDLERYRADPVADGVMSGLAADVEWSASEGATLVVTSAGQPIVELRAGAGLLEARAGAQAWQMPFDGGDVRVVLDAQVVEISCASGVLGLTGAPAGDSLHVLATDATVHPLAR